MTRFKIVLGTLVLLIAAGLTCHGQGVQGDTHLGTWLLTVTPPPGVPPFNLLLTFNAGGGTIATGQNDQLNTPPFASNAGPQMGTWQRGPSGTINATFLSFVFAPNGGPGDAAFAIVKIRATYEFPDADTMTGRGQLLFCDLNGENCFAPGGTATAAVQGKKVQVEDIQ
jgi:hypothetical protein